MGIVGLPNVGKSALFNALLKRQQAYVANFPLPQGGTRVRTCIHTRGGEPFNTTTSMVDICYNIFMDKEAILRELAHKLEKKYRVQPCMFPEQCNVVLENASEPARPIHPEDVRAIIKQIAEVFSLKTGDLAYSINNGNIIVGLPSN